MSINKNRPALVASIDEAFELVDPTEYAGAAQDLAECATLCLEMARMYAGGARREGVAEPLATADLLRRLAATNRDWIPGSLWRGLLRSADHLSR